jgi:hypothetical protein
VFDDDILKKYYPIYDFNNINKYLSFPRTKNGIRRRAMRLGLKGEKYWSQIDLDELCRRYPTEGASKELVEHLGRSRNQIWVMAQQLRIKSNKKYKKSEHHLYTGYKNVSGTYILNLKRAAKRRGIDFNISAEDIYNKIVKQDFKCAYSGRTISFDDKSASTDRVDPKIGYFDSNIQIVHKFVNSSRSDKSHEEYLSWINTIFNFNFNKK